MSAANEVRLRLLATMNEHQMRHALHELISDMQLPEGGTDLLDEILVAAIDADPPEPKYARGGIVRKTAGLVGGERGIECVLPITTARASQEMLDQMRYIPFRGGKLYLPTPMWTDDERDTPKMIVETMSVVQTAMSLYAFHSEVSSGYLQPHNERIARLLKAAERGVQ